MQQVVRIVEGPDASGFPYAVFYVVRADAVVAIAVSHQARDVEHWQPGELADADSAFLEMWDADFAFYPSPVCWSS